MIILGVDTSLALLSVALLRDESLIGAVALEGKGSRNEKLLPAIDWLLTESNIDRKSIELFAVTRGPGSFTGVRIGLATVQGLALALGRPLCAMATHEAIAFAASSAAVVDDAGRGEFFISIYDDGREVVAPRLASSIERDELAKSASLVINVAEFVQRRNVATNCARRALEIARSNALDRYSDITPIYVRLAEAEVKLQQKQNG